MGNVVENRALVEAVPLGPPTPGPAGGWQVQRVRVESAADLAGYPNLLGLDLPRQLEALVPPAAAGRLADADRWRVEASLVGPGRIRIESVR